MSLPYPVPSGVDCAPRQGIAGVQEGPGSMPRASASATTVATLTPSMAQAAAAAAARHGWSAGGLGAGARPFRVSGQPNGRVAAPLAGVYTDGAVQPVVAPRGDTGVTAEAPLGLPKTATTTIPAGSTRVADMLRGVWEPTPLNTALFSDANLTILQNAIRRAVADKSGVVLGAQSNDELLQVLRAMYFQYGRNEPTDIPGQIAALNARVVGWCVPRILSDMAEVARYNYDISHLPVPLAQPVYLSRAGTKTAPMPLPGVQWG